jgi:hypothetical protein
MPDWETTVTHFPRSNRQQAGVSFSGRLGIRVGFVNESVRLSLEYYLCVLALYAPRHYLQSSLLRCKGFRADLHPVA